MARDPVEDNSVSKSLRILQLLACHESMRVTELSRELGVAASTAHRLLNIMRGHDFVEQDIGSPRYRLGPAALKLGRPARSHPHLLPISHPYLEGLSADLNETVNLVVLDGPDALFLLACLPYQSLRALYPDQLRRVTKNTLPDLQALQQECRRCANTATRSTWASTWPRFTRLACPSRAPTAGRLPPSRSRDPPPGGTAEP